MNIFMTFAFWIDIITHFKPLKQPERLPQPFGLIIKGMLFIFFSPIRISIMNALVRKTLFIGDLYPNL